MNLLAPCFSWGGVYTVYSVCGVRTGGDCVNLGWGHIMLPGHWADCLHWPPLMLGGAESEHNTGAGFVFTLCRGFIHLSWEQRFTVSVETRGPQLWVAAQSSETIIIAAIMNLVAGPCCHAGDGKPLNCPDKTTAGRMLIRTTRVKLRTGISKHVLSAMNLLI